MVTLSRSCELFLSRDISQVRTTYPFQKQWIWSPQSDHHGLVLVCMPCNGLFSCDLNILDLRDYPCVHYILWRLLLWTLLLCFMTQYYIAMGNNVARDAHWNITMCNDIARDIHCDVEISNDIAMYTSQCMMTLLWTSFTIYYYGLMKYPYTKTINTHSLIIVILCYTKVHATWKTRWYDRQWHCF